MPHSPVISIVAGARPNFMKVKPVLAALEARGTRVDLVHTGQHYDALMSDVFFDDLGLRAPDFHLGIGSGTQAEQVAKTMLAYEGLLASHPAEAVVVVGDVNATLACAVVGAKSGALVAHVEAGLRSRDWAMPEEVNRVVADRVSDLLLASSPDAVTNLLAEGYREDQIHLVGNTMIDSLLSNVDRAQARPILGDLGVEPGAYALATLHRPSNVDDPEVLRGLVNALAELSTRLPVIFPVHPRTAEALEGHRLPQNIVVLGPQGYLDFIALQVGAAVVLTDSGGIQEETTVLGVPCLTLRTTTERPITVSEGTNQLVGVEPEAILAAALRVIDVPPAPRRPGLWDDKAGERIADVLLRLLTVADWPRPTERVP